MLRAIALSESRMREICQTGLSRAVRNGQWATANGQWAMAFTGFSIRIPGMLYGSLRLSSFGRAEGVEQAHFDGELFLDVAPEVFAHLLQKSQLLQQLRRSEARG